MDGYVQYLEGFLGKIEYGWSKGEEGQKLPFQVVKYCGGPFPDTVTYSTLGLSSMDLTSPVLGKKIRQELFFVAYSSFGDKNIPGILQQVGMGAIRNKRPYLRGDVIGPYGALFETSELEALYVSMPVYFPDSFQTYLGDGDLTIVQTWLFPITAKEANFVKVNGWDKFEDVLVEANPDLLNFNRTSTIV